MMVFVADVVVRGRVYLRCIRCRRLGTLDSHGPVVLKKDDGL